MTDELARLLAVRRSIECMLDKWVLDAHVSDLSQDVDQTSVSLTLDDGDHTYTLTITEDH